MSPDTVVSFLFESMKVAIVISLPVLVAGLIVGVFIGLLQAATQIHEMTLIFIFKLLAVGITILLLFPWILRTLLDFTISTFSNLSNFVR
ncbi:MAG: flagellar biosynthetic protein FliQ [Desulfatiglandales bacterium]